MHPRWTLALQFFSFFILSSYAGGDRKHVADRNVYKEEAKQASTRFEVSPGGSSTVPIQQTPGREPKSGEQIDHKYEIQTFLRGLKAQPNAAHRDFTQLPEHVQDGYKAIINGHENLAVIPGRINAAKAQVYKHGENGKVLKTINEARDDHVRQMIPDQMHIAHKLNMFAKSVGHAPTFHTQLAKELKGGDFEVPHVPTHLTPRPGTPPSHGHGGPGHAQAAAGPHGGRHRFDSGSDSGSSRIGTPTPHGHGGHSGHGPSSPLISALDLGSSIRPRIGRGNHGHIPGSTSATPLMAAMDLHGHHQAPHHGGSRIPRPDFGVGHGHGHAGLSHSRGSSTDSNPFVDHHHPNPHAAGQHTPPSRSRHSSLGSEFTPTHPKPDRAGGEARRRRYAERHPSLAQLEQQHQHQHGHESGSRSPSPPPHSPTTHGPGGNSHAHQRAPPAPPHSQSGPKHKHR